MRPILAIAVALMLVVAGCSQAPGGATTTAETTQPESGVATTTDSGADREIVKPDDPDTDTLGWEDGLWYNETINVTRGDGLNDTELETVVSRSMARVERIRGLEFDERVPVEIQTREEFRAEQRGRSGSETYRTLQNAKFEALFMINESTDSLAVQRRNSGSSVGGYYSPADEEIVVISDNVSTPQLNEITLSQELFHALQDQQFNISSYNQSTRELHNANDGLIEGDGNYVDYLYEQRCRDEWGGDCLFPQTPPGSAGQLANIGPYLLRFQPYSDGPSFVRGVQRRGGWEAVNDLYERPPASTEQVIHPEKYGEDEPAALGIEDASDENWTRLTLDRRPDYASLGEAGLFSMFMYPAFATEGQTQIVPAQSFFNRGSDGEIDRLDPYDYNSTYSDGWDGDKLAVYTSETAAENETGYVWKSVWDSERDAGEFVDGYRQLLRANNATAVEGRANTWRIEGEFADAVHVERTGDTVVVTNAPTVADLGDVREGAAPEQ